MNLPNVLKVHIKSHSGILRPVISILMIFVAFYTQANIINSFDFREKLQTNSVTSVIQDNLGFLWVGYDNGIARFDGYTVTPYSLNNDSIYIGYVNCLYNDEKDNLYIGTTEGLYIYNYLTNTICVFSSQLSGYEITTIMQGKNGSWWVATNHGLYMFNKNQELEIALDKKHGLSNDRINCIAYDSEDHLWVGTESGFNLVTFHSGKTRIKNYFPHYRIASIFIDRNDCLWVCRNEEICIGSRKQILHNGESVFKKITENAETITTLQSRDEVWIGTRGRSILQYKITPGQEPQFIQNICISPDNEIKNTILSFCEDTYSNIWIGTLDGLYLYLRKRDTPFHIVKNDRSDENTPSHNIISSIYCDDENNLWLATAKGINKFTWSKQKKEFNIERYADNRDSGNQIRNNKIQTIVEFRKNRFLISTKSTISFFDSQNKTFYNDPVVNDTLQKHGMKYVRASFKDKDGNIWLAFSEGGIGVLSSSDGKLHKLEFQNYTQSRHRCISRDRNGNLWVSSDDDGLYCLKLGTTITTVSHVKRYDRNMFHRHWLTSLYIDKSNKIWVGTLNGLYYYNPQKDEFELYEFPYSKKDIYVSGIIEDFYNNIWVAGIRGVYRISNKIETQYYEPHSIGDIAKTWYIFGFTIDKDGIIVMGGVNGLIYFNPVEVIPDTYSQSPYISNFAILNEQVLPDGIHLDREINRADEITLSHKDYQFFLEFSALFYPEPMKIKYAYKLEGFDEDWIYTDANRRNVSYSNLLPGKYIFKVKSSSASGVWLNNTKETKITVLPPPWKSWWAYILYILSIIVVVYLLYNIWYLKTRVRYEKELSQWKMRYYINLSHSFKTPLTLLYAPIQTLIKNYEHLPVNEAKELLFVMQRNVRKLSFQISQLMEFRKIDLGKSDLSLTKSDIIPLIREVYNAFRNVALSKDIDYTFECNIASADVVMDTEKIETVLFNLLSNAFKYTPAGGKINVTCQLDSVDYKLWISVKDTGIGIQPEHLEKIFERFWQADTRQEDKFTDSGIGLSLVQEFVRLHQGEIRVESKPYEGSLFRFFLMLGDSHFSSGEYAVGKNEASKSILSETFTDMVSDFEQNMKDSDDKNLPIIYLLGLDDELVQLIKKSLKLHYTFKSFKDWNEFGKQNQEKRLAVVIIDLQINPIQKLDMCRKLKADTSLSNIPIIILSPFATEEDEQNCYAARADAYIPKPFDILFLKTRIEQLIKVREQIKEKVKQELIVNPKEINITSDDDIFLANVMNVLENCMIDENFNIDQLAAQLNISRSMLYRRINQLVGLPPVEFIKSVRLKRAAQLLETTSYNVTEISTMVGFSDQRYFSSCFKKQFGLSPKSYSLNKRNK